MAPLVVPQAQAVWCSPFVRGYGEQLAEEPYGIEPERWIAFVDGLNELLVKNVPLTIVQKIGMVMGFVPSVAVGPSTPSQPSTGF